MPPEFELTAERYRLQPEHLNYPVALDKGKTVFLLGQEWDHNAMAAVFGGPGWQIDSATPDGLPQIIRNRIAAGIPIEDKLCLIHSHCDSDHALGMQVLQDYCAKNGIAIKTYVPIGGIEILRIGDVKSMAAENYDGRVPNFRPSGELGEGIMEINGVPLLKIIPTPGHCDEHISIIHLPSGILLAGDMLGGLSGRSSLEKMHDSIDRIRAEDFLYVAESHAPLPKPGDPLPGLITRAEFFQRFDSFALTPGDLRPGFRYLQSGQW